MKVNKRILIESMIVSTSIVLLGYCWKIVRGYLLTKSYVPDIINNYDSVEYLETSVKFGVVNRFDWITVGVGFLLLVGVYYGARILVNHLIKTYKD